MNILNIHGFAGVAENTNYNILHEAGYNVASFTIDYERCSVLDVNEFLHASIKVFHIDLIVATSYGGFFANVLSAGFGIPFIATNPCVDPSTSIFKLAPDYYYKEARNLADLTKMYYKNWENGVLIIGNEDEVIDHSITKKIVGKAKIYEISGGHRLSKESYEKMLEHKLISYDVAKKSYSFCENVSSACEKKYT